MSIKNIIMNDSLVPLTLPQSYNGIIDESELDQDELVVIIKRHEEVRVGYQIIVHLTPYLSSIPLFITDENIENPTYQITIPFSAIPLGSYNIYYTITDLVANIAKSESTHVTIKKSDSPQPFLEATLIITGYQPIGDEYEILTIQIHDKQTSEQIKDTAVSYKIDQAINISDVSEIGSNPDTIQSMNTDEYGQFKINLKGEVGGNCIIRVTANNRVGSIKYTMGQQ
ncbi:hypothetical protein BDD26_2552 [Xenorhabdus cabanillasii]|uniref:Big-1 domain-containing protein n=1 Tax=Xenorhabdus cabanillasii TaxID=351673 RepID=A0A3D9UEM5_9GAMM|nr:hypothetical protein [Xenorhabdus cabanillasii]REF27736.1 hypothetical protein BDD26_2552 [Xenorhabdus cabanillasii]